MKEQSLKEHALNPASAATKNTNTMSPGKKRILQYPPPTPSSLTEKEAAVDKLLKEAGYDDTSMTKDGWCLKHGLVHIASAKNGELWPLMEQHGPPDYYKSFKACRHTQQQVSPTQHLKVPTTCFQSLCRIVAGQQLHGKAAQAIWDRLLEVSGTKLSPTTVLNLAKRGLEQHLQKPVGLSKNKARSLLDLAERFDRDDLTESFLTTSSEQDVRDALIKVRGLGPWSCDMFLMFYLEKQDILPMQDLGVLKGLAVWFDMKGGKGRKGALCAKKDKGRIEKVVSSFGPFRSLVAYYMWRAADTNAVYSGNSRTVDENNTSSPSKRQKIS